MNNYKLQVISGMCYISGYDKHYKAGHDQDKVQKLVDRLNKAHRPNIDYADNDLVVCWNLHDKHEDCDYEIEIENAKTPTKNN